MTGGAAGRELDVEIARVMFKVTRLYSGHFDGALWVAGDDYPYYIPSGKPWRTHSIDAVVLPRFSTDMAAAWIVVERLGDLGFCCVHVSREYLAILGHVMVDVTVLGDSEGLGDHGRRFHASAETAPLAVCRAALQAEARPSGAAGEDSRP